MDTIEETREERRRRLNRERSARYRATPEGREKAREANARRCATPEGREKVREANARRYAAPDGRQKNRGYQNRRLADNPQFRLAHVTRCRIRDALKAALTGKSARSLDLIGCTAEEFKAHLEGLFLEGMTWENWSPEGWHIDHKRPLASFDLTDPAQQREAFHFTNTAPVWADENLSKGSLHEGVRHRHR